MVDNFEEIGKILTFYGDPGAQDNRDWFYTLIIEKRAKDFGRESPNKFGMAYYISTREEYEACEEEVKRLCDMTGARAYVTPQPASKRLVAVKMMQQLAKAFEYEGYSDIMTLAERTARQAPCEPWYRKWMVDVDGDKTGEEAKAVEEEVRKRFISGKGDFSHIIKTVNGYHVVCSPFDATGFADKFPLYAVIRGGTGPGTLVYANPEVIEKYGLKW